MWKKLKIKEGTKIIALNAPANYKTTLGELPQGVTIANKLEKTADFIQLFVKTRAELEKEFPKAAKALNPGGSIWVTYPKNTSGMQTDLSRDKGWDSLENISMRWIALVSFDEQWSAFLMRNEPPKKENKVSGTYHDLVSQYVDVKKKTVTVPEDLQLALKKNKKAAAFFESISYSGRKEYVIWIVSAKQEATRKERVKKAVEKLVEGKKDPAAK